MKTKYQIERFYFGGGFTILSVFLWVYFADTQNPMVAYIALLDSTIAVGLLGSVLRELL